MQITNKCLQRLLLLFLLFGVFLVRLFLLLLHEVINLFIACIINVLAAVKGFCPKLWEGRQVHLVFLSNCEIIILVTWNEIDPFQQTLYMHIVIGDIFIDWFLPVAIVHALLRVPFASSSLHNSLMYSLVINLNPCSVAG